MITYQDGVSPAMQDVLKEQPIKPPTMLHITDGESVAGTLRQSQRCPAKCGFLAICCMRGRPAGLSEAEWWDRRARFLSESHGLSPEEARHAVRAFEDSLQAISSSDETVLWMDHRLSDQLILIMLLERFSRLNRGRSSLSLDLHRPFPRHGKLRLTWPPYRRAACLAG